MSTTKKKNLIKELTDKSKIVQQNHEPTKFDVTHLCQICSLLLITPYQSDCGCFFCEICLESNEFPRSCIGDSEYCRKDRILTINDLRLDRAKQKYINSLIITCPYCSEISIIEKMLNEHLIQCQRRPVDCPNKCYTKLIAFEDLKYHLEYECEKRLVSCSLNCGEVNVTKEYLDKIHFNLLSKYAQCCSLYSSICPECKDPLMKYTRETIGNHLTNYCPNYKLECPLSFINCPFTSTVAEMKGHLSSKFHYENHLKLLKIFFGEKEKILKVSNSKIQGFDSYSSSHFPTSSSSSMTKIQFTPKQTNDRIHKLQQLAQQTTSTATTSSSSARPSNQSSTPTASTPSPFVNAMAILPILHIADHEFVWIIPDFEANLRRSSEACNARLPSYIDSEPIYAKYNLPSHKFRFRIYLNGNIGTAEGEYISLFYQILAGDWDNYITWPCLSKVSFSLLQQWPITSSRQKITVQMRPTSTLGVAQRPLGERRILGSEAAGQPLFARIGEVRNNFQREGKLYFHITISDF